MIHQLIKTLLIMILVSVSVILPFFIWHLIDRESYEDFLLKSVSPLSMDTRKKILLQRGVMP